MSIAVKSQRVRLQVDASKWFQPVQDIITSASPQIANGADLQFEFIFSYGALADANLVDLTQWASITVSLSSSVDRSGLALWSTTLSNSSFNFGSNTASWLAGTDQPAKLLVTNANNSLLLTSTSGTYWLVVSALTTDSPAKLIPVCCIPVSVMDAGITVTPPSSVTTAAYYTQSQSDARYVQIGTDYTVYARKDGATYTGAVILASAQMTGATGLYAATKAYVDTTTAAVAAASVPNTGVSTIAGVKTFSSLLNAGAGLTVAGTTTLGSLAGVLKGTAGVVSGAATTSDLTEGSNLYFTNARTLASTLTGYAAGGSLPLLTSDTVLTAFQKVGAALAAAYTGITVTIDANQSAMLAHSGAVKGDLSMRSDTNVTYVYKGGGYASLANWQVFYYAVASVNGSTGTVVLTTDNIAEGSTNLYFTNTRADARITAQKNVANGLCPLDASSLVPTANLPASVNTLTTTLTGLTSASYTALSTSDTVLSGFSKIASFLAGRGTLTFQGSTNQGLIVNQLSTTQIGALPTGGSAYGNIVYDSTINSLKALINGSWVSLISNQSLPLSAGSGNPLTGTLYFPSGVSKQIQFDATWSCDTSASSANWDLVQGTTVVLSCDTSNTVHAPNGFFDTPNGYKVSGVQVVGARQTDVTDYSPAGGWSDSTAYSDFTGLTAKVNAAFAVLRAHGLM